MDHHGNTKLRKHEKGIYWVPPKLRFFVITFCMKFIESLDTAV